MTDPMARYGELLDELDGLLVGFRQLSAEQRDFMELFVEKRSDSSRLDRMPSRDSRTRTQDKESII